MDRENRKRARGNVEVEGKKLKGRKEKGRVMNESVQYRKRVAGSKQRGIGGGDTG